MELPEAEVARRDLEREIASRKVKSVEVIGKNLVVNHKTKADVPQRLEGAKIRSFDRRGLFMLGKLDTDEYWGFTLGDSGRLLRVKAGRIPTGLPITMSVAFSQGGSLHVVDPNDTARTFVASKEELLEIPEFADMGLDPLETPVPWQQFGNMLLRSSRTKLKAILQNPKMVCGLGPVYSDEVLFAAGLRYDRTPDSLSTHEFRRLYRAMIEVLVQAVKLRGVSFSEDDVDMFGEPGLFGPELKVYERTGLTCQRCRGTVEKAKFQKKNVFFCGGCQS